MPSRKLTLRITDYPQDIVDIKEVKLPSDISYNLITGHADSLSHIYTEELIKHLLPQSKYQIVDICLPYSYTSIEGKVQRLNARYILFDNRLMGIRVKCGSKWPAGKVEYCRLPEYILLYYRQEGKMQQQANIPVGHFYLQLNRCKIALFFQSQINEKPASLIFLEKFKFDIISVLCDVPSKTNQMRISESLKRISKKDIVTVIYAGLRIAPKTTLYYDTKSFIIQGGKQAPQQRFYLGQPRITQLLVDLQQTFEKKISKMVQDKSSTDYSSYQSQQLIERLRPVSINLNVPNYDKLPQKENSIIYNKQNFNQILEKYQVQLLHLWYIFKTIHKGSPFVIPYPFLDATDRLFENLLRLEKYANLSIKKLVKVYCYKSNKMANSKLDVIIYDSFQKMYEENKAVSFPKYAFIYSHDSSQINAFKTNSKYREIICNCSSLNPYCEQNKRNVVGQQHQILQKRRRQKACSEVLKNYENLDQILEYFKKIDFYQKDIEICFADILPRKAQENFKNTPLQYILLNFSKQKMLKQIETLWDNKKNYLQNDSLERVHSHIGGIQPNTLQNKIDQCKKRKKNINIRKAKCHFCSFYIKTQFIHYCRKCKQLMCYDCIFQRSEKKLMNSIDQYPCLICTKKCHCKICQPIILNEAYLRPISDDDKIKNKQKQYCNICFVYQIKKRIFIECDQCKKDICYICFKRTRSIISAKQSSTSYKSKTICQKCEQLNKQQNVTSFYNPITIKQQDIQQEKQVRQVDIIVNKYLSLPQRQNKSVPNKEKERKQNTQPQLNNSKSMQKLVDIIQEGKKKKKKAKRSSPSFSQSSKSSSSSSSGVSLSSQNRRVKKHKEKKNRNSKSKSRSRSRSRSREKFRSKPTQKKDSRKHEKKQAISHPKNTQNSNSQITSKEPPSKFPQYSRKIEKSQQKLWTDPSKSTKRQLPNNSKPDPRLNVRQKQQISAPKVQASKATVGQIVPISNYTSIMQQDHSY